MLREMMEADIDSVALLLSRALAAEEGRPLGTKVTERARANWAHRLSEATQWAIVHLERDVVVGVCHGEPELDAATREPITGVGHLTGLFVEPTVWGRGYGRELLRAGADRLAKLGYERALRWSAADNDRANGLYESEGWRRTGRERVGLDGRNEAEYTKHLVAIR
jgi:GNAT superfamily N-acetyltransferase